MAAAAAPSSSSPSSSEDLFQNEAAIRAFIEDQPAVKLRCGVRKFIVSPGGGAELSQPYADVMVQYALYGYDMTPEGKDEARLRKAKRGRRPASEEDDGWTAPIHLCLLDNQAAVAVTVGITALLPGLEIGLLSMREGEHAIIQIPPGLGFRAALPLRVPALAVQHPVIASVLVKQATAVEQLPCNVLRSIKTRGEGPLPQIDDIVTINVTQPHPTTMAKGNRATSTVTLGESIYDDALLGAPRGSVMSCFVNLVEHNVLVMKIESSGRPQPFVRGSDKPLSPYEWSDPAAPLDLLETPKWLRTALTPAERFAECERWKSIGRRCFETQQHLKAVRVYRRAAAFLLAEPSLLADNAHEAATRKELAIVFNNLGRALMTLGNSIWALESVEQALRFNTGYAKAYFLQAQLHRQLGQFKESLSALDMCAQCTDCSQTEVLAERERVVAEQAAAIAASEGSDNMGSAAASLD